MMKHGAFGLSYFTESKDPEIRKCIANAVAALVENHAFLRAGDLVCPLPP